MPIQTPCAPSASAAAMPRPSTIPPAASTGTGATASTTAGTSASVATSPQTWPPASQPCAQTTSTPAATRRPPPRPCPATPISSAPAAWTRSTYGLGSPQASETISTPAASTASSRPSGGHSSRMFAWNGFDVSARTSSTNAATSSGFVQLSAIVPSAPASETAAASAGTDAPPIGACTIGTSIPNRSQTGVRTRLRLCLTAMPARPWQGSDP